MPHNDVILTIFLYVLFNEGIGTWIRYQFRDFIFRHVQPVVAAGRV